MNSTELCIYPHLAPSSQNMPSLNHIQLKFIPTHLTIIFSLDINFIFIFTGQNMPLTSEKAPSPTKALQFYDFKVIRNISASFM